MNSIERLLNVVHKDGSRIIGLMSGMSMDAVDLAQVRISGAFPDLKVELEGSHSRPYDASLRGRLERAREQASAAEAAALNVEVAVAFADCVQDHLARHQIDAASIDAIGSHGQTIVHIPPTTAGAGATLQLGSGSVIAQRTGILTISNFRAADMAVGGHGAAADSARRFRAVPSPCERCRGKQSGQHLQRHARHRAAVGGHGV